MQNTKSNLLFSLFISISILIGCIWIGYSIQQTNLTNPRYLSKSLITQDEAADYLSFSPETFDNLIFNDAMERSKTSSYDTYAFLPYIIVNDNKYFNLELLDLWVEYNSLRHTRFEIK